MYTLHKLRVSRLAGLRKYAQALQWLKHQPYANPFLSYSQGVICPFPAWTGSGTPGRTNTRRNRFIFLLLRWKNAYAKRQPNFLTPRAQLFLRVTVVKTSGVSHIGWGCTSLSVNRGGNPRYAA